MYTRSMLTMLLVSALFLGCGAGLLGCGAGEEAESESQSGSDADNSSTSVADNDESTDGVSGVSSQDNANEEDSLGDAELASLAETMGMTVADLKMKKQMMMDNGMSAEEIAKVFMMGGDPSAIFKDEAESNSEPPEAIRDLIFFQDDVETEVKLADKIGTTNLVLVFTRGYSGGMICPFCTTQVAQLAARHQEFVDRDTSVLVIYPGSSDHLPDFVAAVTNVDREKADVAAVKWPVLLDPDLSAVNLLNIAADLAQPSTFIIDKQGNVVFAYVGANRTDRPSVNALLGQLDALQ